MTVYRGITIKCEKMGAYNFAGNTQPIERYKAKVNDKPVIGTLDEVKKKIDEELGPDVSDSTNAD